jgi:Tfp pilus assembly protein PilE
MPHVERHSGRGAAGQTLVELMLVFTLIGILVGWASPRFEVAMEQTRVDQAASMLRSVWLAERMHWLEHKTFTDELDELAAQRFVDQPLVAQTAPFTLSIDEADAQTLEVEAVRTGGSVWTGTLSLDATGAITGSTQDDGGHVVSPSP